MSKYPPDRSEQNREPMEQTHESESAYNKGTNKSGESAKREDRKMECHLGSRYQMDIATVSIADSRHLYLISVLEAESLFCVGFKLSRDMRADTLFQVLRQACKRYGRPKKVLTDKAPGFYSGNMRQSKFQQYMTEMQIEHIVAKPHGHAMGKVERFHRTLKKEVFSKRQLCSMDKAVEAIGEYITEYNYERCHDELGGARPAARFYSERNRQESGLSSKSIDSSKRYFIRSSDLEADNEYTSSI